MILSYFYWNPPRELFTIPFIDRPIVWYGVLFALGFFLAYLVTERLLKEHLLKNYKLAKKDISSFSRFLMSLKNHKDNEEYQDFLSHCSKTLHEKIAKWNLSQPIDSSFEDEILHAMNSYILAEEKVAIKTAKQAKLFKIALSQSESPKSSTHLLRRLRLEELFACSIYTYAAKARQAVEKITIFAIIGTIIGARLGHLLFYENFSFYLKNPLEIVKTWEGGLASHGGIIGIMIAFLIYSIRSRNYLIQLSFVKIIDFSVIAASLSACFIRLGNFFNQEILGKASSAPWAILFGNPIDGSQRVPRHPAQLYEAIFYLITFIGLMFLRKKAKILDRRGAASGLFFTLVFSFRFFIEFLKEEQSIYQVAHLNMGQILSIPMILLGIGLLAMQSLNSRKLARNQ